MPVIKSAIKKLRRDKKVERANDVLRKNLDTIINVAKKQKTQASLSSAFSQIDRAVKKKLVHKRHAARVKSGLSKLVKPVSRQIKKTASKKSAKSKS